MHVIKIQLIVNIIKWLEVDAENVSNLPMEVNSRDVGKLHDSLSQSKQLSPTEHEIQNQREYTYYDPQIYSPVMSVPCPIAYDIQNQGEYSYQDSYMCSSHVNAPYYPQYPVQQQIHHFYPQRHFNSQYPPQQQFYNGQSSYFLPQESYANYDVNFGPSYYQRMSPPNWNVHQYMSQEDNQAYYESREV